MYRRYSNTTFIMPGLLSVNVLSNLLSTLSKPSWKKWMLRREILLLFFLFLIADTMMILMEENTYKNNCLIFMEYQKL